MTDTPESIAKRLRNLQESLLKKGAKRKEHDPYDDGDDSELPPLVGSTKPVTKDSQELPDDFLLDEKTKKRLAEEKKHEQEEEKLDNWNEEDEDDGEYWYDEHDEPPLRTRLLRQFAIQNPQGTAEEAEAWITKKLEERE